MGINFVTAELFRKSMNTSADPCVDFYEYACGGWGENLQIPSDEVEWNIDAMVQKDISLMKKRNYNFILKIFSFNKT